MKIVIGVAGSLGLVAIIGTVLTLAAFSQRLGELRKMPPLYRGFYFGGACMSVALFVRFLRVSALVASAEGPSFLKDDLFYLLSYHLPLALGLTINLVVTWRYWSWLLRERV